LNAKEKRDIVLKFIEKQQGCKAEDIVEGVKNHISRVVVFATLKDLIKDKLIIDKKQNRRDHKYFPNINNEFITIKKVLEEFKKSYDILLEKSLKHPKIVDVLDEVNMDMSSSEYMESISMHTIGFIVFSQLNEFEKATNIFQKRKSILNNLNNNNEFLTSFLERYNIFGDQKENDKDVLNHAKSEILKIKDLLNKNFLIIDKAKLMLEQYSICIRKCGYLVLRLWPVYIFMILVHFINIKCFSKWVLIIKDKNELLRLNKFVYEEIFEINGKLIEFLSKTDILMEHPANYIKTNMFSIYENNKTIQMIYDYKILEMGKEIFDVMNSLSKIAAKDFIYDEEKYLVKMCERSKKLLNSFNK